MLGLEGYCAFRAVARFLVRLGYGLGIKIRGKLKLRLLGGSRGMLHSLNSAFWECDVLGISIQTSKSQICRL
jgi:hypothetical protein